MEDKTVLTPVKQVAFNLPDTPRAAEEVPAHGEGAVKVSSSFASESATSPELSASATDAAVTGKGSVDDADAEDVPMTEPGSSASGQELKTDKALSVNVLTKGDQHWITVENKI